MRLNTDEWKEFRVGDWFTVDCCTGYDAGIIGVNKIKTDEFPYEFIGRTSDNYGLQGYVKELNSPINKKNTISISQVGTIVAQYRKNDYYTSQNMFKLTAIDRELSEVQSLFVTSVLNKMLTKYTGYSSYPTKGDLINELILLPPKNNEPDWDFMEEYIKEIEEKYIEKVDEYNQENIQKALSVVRITEDELDEDLVIEPADRYEKFKVGDILKVTSSKKIYHASDLIISDIKKDGLYPYIVRSTQNRGIRGYINKDPKYLNDKNTLSFAQDTFISFYQKEPYFTGNKVKVLKPLFDVSENKLLYIEGALNKSILSKSWGTGSTVDSIENIKILLPAIDKETPDFEYMEKAIYIYILRKSLSIGKWIMKKKSML